MRTPQREQLQQEKAVMGFVVTALAGGVGEERNGDSIQSLPHEFQKKPPAPGSARRPGGDGKTKAQSAVERSSEGCVWQVSRETHLLCLGSGPRVPTGVQGCLGARNLAVLRRSGFAESKTAGFFSLFSAATASEVSKNM